MNIHTHYRGRVLIAPRRRTRLLLLFHWWPVRSWPDRGRQFLSSHFHHGELYAQKWEESCARLRDVHSVCKKENKNKNKRNPGKIQLARDPTASDDACPPPSSNPGLARLFAAAIGWRAHQGKATASKSRDVNCSLRAALVCCSFSSLSLSLPQLYTM
jgi:hypothetical protein